MGMKNPPFMFQRAIISCLGDLPFVHIYINDLLIHSKTTQDHLKHLEIVLERLLDSNICINYDKSVSSKKKLNTSVGLFLKMVYEPI